MQKDRLLTWGDLAGVSRPQEERLRALNIKEALVERCLNSMKSLFLDASKLENLYGLKNSPVDTPTERLNTLSLYRTNLFYKSFARFSGQQKTRISLTRRTQWAIHDKGKFESLIHHVKDLVDSLHKIVPILGVQQDEMTRQDISTLISQN